MRAGSARSGRRTTTKVDRLVAVKVLTGDGSADNDRQVARFAREAAVAGGLSHPNIVTVHDFGSALQNGRQYAYLVMELLRGKPLSVVWEGGRLPLPGGLCRRCSRDRASGWPDPP